MPVPGEGIGARIAEVAVEGDRAAFVDRVGRAHINMRRDVVDGEQHGIAAHAAVVVHDRVSHRVKTIVQSLEAHAAAMAIFNDLTIAGDHVPGDGIRVIARIAEGAHQVDHAAFVERLVIAGIGGRGNVVHIHERHVAGRAAVIIGHRVRDRVKTIVHRLEAEARPMAIVDDLAIAGHDMPEDRVRVVARIAEGARQVDGAAFVDGLIVAGIDRRAGVQSRDRHRIAAHAAIIIGDRQRDRVDAIVGRRKHHVGAGSIGDHLAIAGHDMPQITQCVGRTHIADQASQIEIRSFGDRHIIAERHARIGVGHVQHRGGDVGGAFIVGHPKGNHVRVWPIQRRCREHRRCAGRIDVKIASVVVEVPFVGDDRAVIVM